MLWLLVGCYRPATAPPTPTNGEIETPAAATETEAAGPVEGEDPANSSPAAGMTALPEATAASAPESAIIAETPPAESNRPAAVVNNDSSFHYGVAQLLSTVADMRSPQRVAVEMEEVMPLGVNLVSQGFDPDFSADVWQSYLDTAQQHGMAVLGEMVTQTRNPDPADLSPILNLLDAIGGHPALVGFTYLHEPMELFSAEEIRSMYSQIKSAHPEVRLAVLWSGQIAKAEQAQNASRRFTDGMCDICIVNLKPFQSDPGKEEEDGLARFVATAAIIPQRDPDAEIWSSAQVWSPEGGGRRGFRVPSAAEMENLFCALRQSGPLHGFFWGVWTTSKSSEPTLNSLAMATQRQAVADSYLNCIQS